MKPGLKVAWEALVDHLIDSHDTEPAGVEDLPLSDLHLLHLEAHTSRLGADPLLHLGRRVYEPTKRRGT